DWAAVRQYLQTGQAQLPPGCLLDVELSARDVLRELLPRGAAAALEGYRRLRDELGRRPTATEVLRAGYLPRTIAAERGAWFAFVQSEQDLMEREAAVVTAAADWFRMLETTSLNRSYKLIVLRVLLDRGALVSGLPLATLCADCRRYLQQHEVLRRDVTGGGVAVDVDTATAQAWQQWWQKWPVSRWLDEQDGRRWFEQSGDVFRWSGEVPAGLETELQRMTGELVDWRLAAYCRSRGLERGSAEQGAVRFECRVSHASGRAILFVPSVNQSPGRPTGPTDVVLPDGQLWVFKFVKVAVNVAGPAGVEQNQLSDLLRGWFGADAGLPGTDFRVRFELRGGQWSISPVLESAQQGAPAVAVPAPALPAGMRQTISAGRRYRDYLPVWDLAASAGFWSAEQQPEERGWVRVEGMTLKAGMFVGQVCGHSMEPQIADGAWCVFRPCPAGSREGRLLLVQLRTGVSDDAAGRFTVKRYHSEGSVTAEGWEHRVIQLQPLNSDYPVIDLQPEDSEDLRIIGEFVRVL
ncbi:MAG: helix-turn-helix transcriptional regulator, partial [Planctomyces sp.]